jgi:hypothetical protein
VSENKFCFEITDSFEKPANWDEALHCAIMVRGEIFFIDRAHFLFLSSRKTYIRNNKYLFVDLFNRKKDYYHRYIMNAPKGLVVDHISGEPWDNRKINLRVVHNAHNQANKKGKKPKGFRGIRERDEKWVASIGFNNGNIHIGTFDLREDAAKAYDLKAIECFGACAVTNFPKENYQLPERCLADDLPPSIIIKTQKLLCEWPGCKKNRKVGASFCFRHIAVTEQREKTISEGRGVRVITTAVSKFCIHPEHGDQKVNSFARSLCAYHYCKQRESEGYKKPPKKHYPCSFEGCTTEANHIAERLCEKHWKIVNKIAPKKKGRKIIGDKPQRIVVKCVVEECQSLGFRAEGYCTKHRFLAKKYISLKRD